MLTLRKAETLFWKRRRGDLRGSRRSRKAEKKRSLVKIGECVDLKSGRLWLQQSPKVKALLLYLGFGAFIIIGAAVFYAIEMRYDPYDYQIEPWLKKSDQTCLGYKPFWAFLLYALNCASTIGFGQCHVCTTPSRVLTVIYSGVGIPFLVYLLADLGNKLCHALLRIYSKGCKHFRWVKWRYRRWKGRKLQSSGKHRCFRLPTNEIRWIDASDITTVSVRTSAADCDKYDTLKSIKSIRSNGWITSGNPGTPEADANKDLKEFRIDIELESTSTSIPDDSYSDSENEDNQDDDDAAEKVSTDGDGQDLPLWICVVLIIFLILSITIHIHEFEHMAYSYSLYYCLLFFIMQEYEIRDFRNVIFTFSLLLTGLAIISTTINAIILNVQNLVNRARNRLPEEIRRRKEAAAAAGNPDAVIDPEEVLRELLAEEGGMFTRSVMPKSTIENLEDLCEATVQEVEQEMEEEAAAEREAVARIPEVATRDTSTTTQTIRYHNAAVGPNISGDVIWRDTGTDPHIGGMDQSTITDHIQSANKSTNTAILHLVDQYIQCVMNTPMADRETNTRVIKLLDKLIHCRVDMICQAANTINPIMTDSGMGASITTADVDVQVAPTKHHKPVQLPIPVMADTGMLAVPETSDVITQYPQRPPSLTPDDLTPKQKALEQKTIAEIMAKPIRSTLAAASKRLTAVDLTKLRTEHVAQDGIGRWRRREHAGPSGLIRSSSLNRSTRSVTPSFRGFKEFGL